MALCYVTLTAKACGYKCLTEYNSRECSYRTTGSPITWLTNVDINGTTLDCFLDIQR